MDGLVRTVSMERRSRLSRLKSARSASQLAVTVTALCADRHTEANADKYSSGIENENHTNPTENVMSDASVVHSDPGIVSGEPVFVGTRVPVRSLVDWLEGGHTLDEFLDNFPTVRREQAVCFLEEATEALLSRVPDAA
jgi:uncharacterized protein (DUF433 family)